MDPNYQNLGYDDEASSSKSPINLKLIFSNEVAPPVYTGECIIGKAGAGGGNKPIEVLLVDSNTKQTITTGPAASAKVKMVLLRGDYGGSTTREFEKNIVVDWEKKKNILLGDICFDLKQGCGVVGGIKIKHDRNAIKNVKFRLGAMVVGCPYEVQEAVTDPFQVKDRRNKPKTLRRLSLEDNVWSLSNISDKSNGKIRKRLENKKIRTVKKFLHMLFSNPQELQEICGIKGKKWEKIMNHAKTSLIGNMRVEFMSQQSNTLASDDYDGSIEFDNDGYEPQSCEVEHLSIDLSFSINDLPISDMYLNVFELGQANEESGMNVALALVGNGIEGNGFTAKERWMKMLFVSITIGTFAKKITLYVSDLIG